jgi:hypothetical protein
MDEKQIQRMHNYIEALEEANEQLVFALKQCLELLSRIKSPASDETSWQDMLAQIEQIIKLGERVAMREKLH